MSRACALALTLLLAAPAGAEPPPVDYFTGIYERIGRSAAPEVTLIDDLVRIDPSPDGQGLRLSVCGPEGAPGSGPLDLRFDRFGDVQNLLQGGTGAEALYCQYFNDAGNYPILACASEGAAGQVARFTLWAVTDDRVSACAP